MISPNIIIGPLLAPSSLKSEGVINLLNEALSRDYDAVSSLFMCRSSCNEALAFHPTIEVRRESEHWPERAYSLGVIGLINGMLTAAGEPKICMAMKIRSDGSERLVGFAPFPKGASAPAPTPANPDQFEDHRRNPHFPNPEWSDAVYEIMEANKRKNAAAEMGVTIL